MAIPTVSLDALTAAAREENRLAARKISACYYVHRSWITLDTKHKHYSRYGRTEMAVALGCSATVAEAYVSVGVALHTRLPLVKKAFEAGEIDLPRVRVVCRILDNLSDDIVKSVEDEIVEAARRSSPGPLEKEIWDILLRVAPEEAAALREFAKRFRNVSYAPAGELARIRAELTAPEAAAAWQLLEEMADTLCPKDPRGKQDRLCDAFMARMHGEPRLVCLCQRADCPKKDAELPDRRVPLTMVTVDIATLIGLLANPAYLAGHGSIDPDLARELARNSQWQILLTEAVTLAEKLGLAVQNPETGDWEQRSSETTAEPSATEPDATQTNAAEPDATQSNAEPNSAKPDTRVSRTDTGTGTGTGPGTATNTAAPLPSIPPPSVPPPSLPDPGPHPGAGPGRGSGSGSGSVAAESHSTPDPTPPEPTEYDETQHRQRRRSALASSAALFCTHTPVGRGTRHSSALDLSLAFRPNNPTLRPAGCTAQRTSSGIYLGNASLAAALEAAIAADPTLGKSVGRDPLTDRALIYRPDALTTTAVRLRDRHCRFPGCHRPAERCQLDHIIAFDHANPLGGGWTTVNNLQCLCEYHHSVKTAGYWKAVMLPGGAILWTSTSKTTRITLPANGTAVPIIGNDLRPYIPTKPKRSGIVAYPDPPDNPTPTPQPEPNDEEDDTAPPF
ncbi:HNH endonuclease signature motif containing protein [Rhodococcoides fascians]|uniref:HNH endonuclease signature motif containing protein n=1 Tax=Rhodococcoides fascians TaxID=1828 RepID=UPI00068FAE5B|nr:HNH endonuclease signature motif containing protein [Rhodococcus fascians]